MRYKEARKLADEILAAKAADKEPPDEALIQLGVGMAVNLARIADHLAPMK